MEKEFCRKIISFKGGGTEAEWIVCNAYSRSQVLGLEFLDFDFDSMMSVMRVGVSEIVSALKSVGITEMTISGDYQGFIETFAEFARLGCYPVEFVKVKTKCGDEKKAILFYVPQKIEKELEEKK